MGCTVTAFLAQGTAMCVANVGDSRTYGFDGAQIQRLTTDHSLVARLVTAGMLAPDDVYSHPQRSQIYRSLGDEGELIVDLFPREARPGETYILCSDGLWEMVRDPDIAALLHEQAGAPAQQVAEQLIQLANANGGEDNVSVIVAQVTL
jgi:serine/threonine protein phosphatase PrpC